MKRFSCLLETILSSQGGYLADTLYAFKRSTNVGFQLEAIKAKKTPKLHWLIIGREHYFETSKEYPIANKRDLKKALQFDDNKAPFEGITLQYIERVDEQTHRVTFWVINPKIIEGLASAPWLILPESYLLAKALNENINLATIKSINKTVFISKNGRRLFSGVQSIQTPNIESFAFSTGSPINMSGEQSYNGNSTELTELLLKGMKSLNIAQLSGFLVNLNNTNRSDYPWKQALVISSVAFVFYLALSSGWLVFKQQQLNQQITNQKTQVNQALTLQKTYQQQLKWNKVLAEPLNNAFPYWKTWPIVLEAIAVGAEFKAIHYQNNKIILHGTADKTIKATDVLAKLSKNHNVLSASFSQPVRKYQNKEDFVISFSFAKNITTQKPELTAKQVVK